MATTTLDPIDTTAPSLTARPATRAGRLRRSVPLLVLLAGTAVLYLWGLGASGYGNSFYAAAVQAGTQSWKALFFGSLDSANFITVDKPPAALWVMGLSGRVFGFNAWSMLVPQALAGVASVGLLYATVRRWFGSVAGLLAGTSLALTPVAVLMFRFNNPDALLVLLLVAGAYATTRAVEKASTGWLLLAGTAVGFGFLTKMLQAFLVLPAFALVYLVAAPTPLRRRILQILAAAAAVVVSAGWWVAIVQLWPASSRPYIGGSQNNSVLGLALGYNGLGRIFGQSGRSGGGGAPGGAVGGAAGQGGMGGGFGGATGITRMFGAEFGTQVSWLLPAALILLAAVAWLTRRAPRTDRTRAGLLLWGGWLVVTAGVFSYMSGIIHPYYTVALAPAIGALVGIGGVTLWRELARPGDNWYARAALAGTALVTGWWGYTLLARDASWQPWLRYALLAVALLATAALVIPRRLPALSVAAATLGAATILFGSAAYALPTAATPHTGSIPSAGPAGSTFAGMGGGRRMGGGSGEFGGFSGPGGFGAPGGSAPGSGTQSGGAQNGRPQNSGAQNGAPHDSGAQNGDAQSGGPQNSGSRSTVDGAAGPGSIGGGPGGTESTSSELAQLLRSAGTTWSAATTGDQSAAGLELASGTAVMAIGGWSGSDPTPTLDQFKQWVAQGKVHYYIAGAGGGMAGAAGGGVAGAAGGAAGGGLAGAAGGGRGDSSIATWVRATFSTLIVGGQTIYDLTKPTG